MITFGATLELSRLALKVERLDIRGTPQQLFSKLKQDRENVFLLESASGDRRLAEYSFVGFDPAKLVTLWNHRLDLTDIEKGTKDSVKVEDPLDELRRLVPPDTVGGHFRFVGGAVGYVSYDATGYWERTQANPRNARGMPEMEFGIFNDGVVFDHIRKQVHYYTLDENRVEKVKRAAKQNAPDDELKSSEPRPSMTRGRFEEMVRAAKEYILSGDIFQVVLSKSYDFDVDGELGRFYAELSKINPSPYMYFLKFGDRRIVGSSPEMLLRVEDRRLETFPIAGTRPHLKNARKDAMMTEELRRDPKENAEHVMLVDLARNDVGRVSKYGSVRTSEFMTVRQFSHVQHLVSHVVGELRNEYDSYDALRALFPAGTVSGAPKVRAMQIIDELERQPRGPYAGAVGYFSFSGNADFAITIRTLIANGEKVSIQTGAGIVADSQPATEYEETDAKAAGLLKALRLATEGRR